MSSACFQRIASSDESGMSDNDDNENKIQTNPNDGSTSIEAENVSANVNDSLCEIKASKKLEIVEHRKNLNKKFSIWSEILMEEELNESMNNSLKLKQKRYLMRKQRKEKDSDNYAFWTKEDFERKFGTKKSKSMKIKIKSKELKKDIAREISRELKEERIDIIKRIVHVIGEEKACRLKAEVLDIEAAGGMMTSDGNRRRSPGGVFFFLVKSEPCLTAEQKRDIFCDSLVKINDKKYKKKRQEKAKNYKKGSDKEKKKKKKKKNKKTKNKK